MTWGIVAHESHPLHATKITCADLTDYPWIEYDAVSNGEFGLRQSAFPGPRHGRARATNEEAGESDRPLQLDRFVHDAGRLVSFVSSLERHRQASRCLAQTLARRLGQTATPHRPDNETLVQSVVGVRMLAEDIERRGVSRDFSPMSWSARRFPAERAGEARRAMWGIGQAPRRTLLAVGPPPFGSRPGARPRRRRTPQP